MRSIAVVNLSLPIEGGGGQRKCHVPRSCCFPARNCHSFVQWESGFGSGCILKRCYLSCGQSEFLWLFSLTRGHLPQATTVDYLLSLYDSQHVRRSIFFIFY